MVWGARSEVLSWAANGYFSGLNGEFNQLLFDSKARGTPRDARVHVHKIGSFHSLQTISGPQHTVYSRENGDGDKLYNEPTPFEWELANLIGTLHDQDPQRPIILLKAPHTYTGHRIAKPSTRRFLASLGITVNSNSTIFRVEGLESYGDYGLEALAKIDRAWNNYK